MRKVPLLLALFLAGCAGGDDDAPTLAGQPSTSAPAAAAPAAMPALLAVSTSANAVVRRSCGARIPTISAIETKMGPSASPGTTSRSASVSSDSANGSASRPSANTVTNTRNRCSGGRANRRAP